MIALQAESSSVIGLLRDGAERFDASPLMQEAAQRSARRGFQGGAEWTALALSEIRGTIAIAPRSGAVRLGLIKYGGATFAAALVAWVSVALGHLEILPIAVLAFYAVEAQGAFLFPAFADGAASPWARSRALVAAAGGTASVAARTLVIAFVMLFGGFAGRGFLRSWCIGCLAIVLWYERLRR